MKSASFCRASSDDAAYVYAIRKVVEEARKRLLEKHASALQGYLPKGALKSKDELKYVQELTKQRTNCAEMGL